MTIQLTQQYGLISTKTRLEETGAGMDLLGRNPGRVPHFFPTGSKIQGFELASQSPPSFKQLDDISRMTKTISWLELKGKQDSVKRGRVF
jgi:hypothetical protein